MKRQVTRCTWFCLAKDEPCPYPEEFAEELEYHFQQGVFEVVVPTPDHKFKVVMKSNTDIRHYDAEVYNTYLQTSEDGNKPVLSREIPFLPVLRGWPGKS